MDSDLALALQLQDELNAEKDNSVLIREEAPLNTSGDKPLSIIDPRWELTDPIPDIRALLVQFDARFFWGRLYAITVTWSPRMYTCAGVCEYEGRGGLCSIRLSGPLLKLRPRKDLVETLLHEMIHAYLFVTDNNKDHDGHGNEFHKHMYRINKESGTDITVYHTFHDEVNEYKKHWWRCSGPCRERPPYYGYVKRTTNRAPSVRDLWWDSHKSKCGGVFAKVKEPTPKKKAASNKTEKSKVPKKTPKKKTPNKNGDIRSFGDLGNVLGSSTPKPSTKDNNNDNVNSITKVPTPSMNSTVPTITPSNNNNIATSNNANSGKSNVTKTSGDASSVKSKTSGVKTSTGTGSRTSTVTIPKWKAKTDDVKETTATENIETNNEPIFPGEGFKLGGSTNTNSSSGGNVPSRLILLGSNTFVSPNKNPKKRPIPDDFKSPTPKQPKINSYFNKTPPNEGSTSEHKPISTNSTTVPNVTNTRDRIMSNCDIIDLSDSIQSNDSDVIVIPDSPMLVQPKNTQIVSKPNADNSTKKCPVCSKVIDEDMNVHLDLCLFYHS